MSIKKLEDHLNSTGEKEIAQIRTEKEQSIAALKEEVRESSKQAVDKINVEGAREAEGVKKRVIAKAKIGAKDRIERQKIQFAEEVLQKAKEKIISASNPKKKEILKKLADEAKAEVREPVVYVDKKYASLLPGAKTKDIGDFGVIVQGKESGVLINNTLEMKIERTRDEMMPKIIAALFG